jgi:hypothetical protein
MEMYIEKDWKMITEVDICTFECHAYPRVQTPTPACAKELIPGQRLANFSYQEGYRWRARATPRYDTVTIETSMIGSPTPEDTQRQI